MSADQTEPRAVTATTPTDDDRLEVKVIDIPATDAECRICLETDEISKLVAPCQCSGTVSYAHLTCLKQWVRERASLKCEICGQPYKDNFKEELQPEVDAGLQRRRQQRAGQQPNPTQQGEDEEEEETDSKRKTICKVFSVIGAFAVLICLLLVLGMKAADAVWAAVLLRIVAFTLPLFLIFKAGMACCEMRRYNRNVREIETRYQQENRMIVVL